MQGPRELVSASGSAELDRSGASDLEESSRRLFAVWALTVLARADTGECRVQLKRPADPLITTSAADDAGRRASREAGRARAVRPQKRMGVLVSGGLELSSIDQH